MPPLLLLMLECNFQWIILSRFTELCGLHWFAALVAAVRIAVHWLCLAGAVQSVPGMFGTEDAPESSWNAHNLDVQGISHCPCWQIRQLTLCQECCHVVKFWKQIFAVIVHKKSMGNQMTAIDLTLQGKWANQRHVFQVELLRWQQLHFRLRHTWVAWRISTTIDDDGNGMTTMTKTIEISKPTAHQRMWKLGTSKIQIISQHGLRHCAPINSSSSNN